ncbi:metallophosphoesterase [Trichloromonas sp.]|uniref:metallophosphoesterase n=1 Tax=Trichloromonas sp. TaxID=3069249 RepID=UPI002A43970B|nr:metallophosphoesterase [Trichloromonas sp.]
MPRLIIFLTVFLSLYSAMHLLAYLGLRPLLASRERARRPVLLFMLLMIAAPVLVRLLERLDLDGAARLLAIIGYSWMAFIFLTFAGFVAVFAWDLLLTPLARYRPTLAEWKLHGPRCALLVPALALLLSIYGVFEARNLTVETLRIPTDKLPAEGQSLRIVQISDLHLGLLHRHGKLEQVARRIEELKPDLLVATGDIVDARLDHIVGLTDIFRRLTPPLGKYAVTGNHEYYAGLDQALDFLEESGFILLRDRATRVGPLLLVGVDDPAGGHSVDEATLVNLAERCHFTLLLKHRPLITPGEEVFDLQLSGHAHRGQIIPFNLVTALEYPLQNGLYRLPTGALLYASRGTGTWGPPIRVFAPPEITLIELFPRR